MHVVQGLPMEKRMPQRAAATAALRTAGVRVTNARIAILTALLGNRTHPTMEQVLALTKPLCPSLTLATVYRTVDQLIRQGVLLGVHASRNGLRCDPDTAPHAHAICRDCGMTYDVPLKKAPRTGPTPDGFTTTCVEVILHGICPDCSAAALLQDDDCSPPL
jgi:Fur family transcriptional regulator, peroxide stress response regulator